MVQKQKCPVDFLKIFHYSKDYYGLWTALLATSDGLKCGLLVDYCDVSSGFELSF